MKYIGYWEFDPKDIEAVIKKYYAFRKIIGKPGMKGYPNPISPSYQVGEMNGFQLFELEHESQMAHLVAFYRPEMRWEFIPIIPAKDSIDVHFMVSRLADRVDLMKEVEAELEEKKKEIDKKNQED